MKLGTVAVRILLENASFRQVLKPVRTSKLTFPHVIWRHPAKHPLGFRVVLVTTTSIHLHILFRSNLTGNSSPALFKPNYYNKNSAFRQPFFICPAPRRNAPCFSILHYNKTGVCRSDESGRRRFLFLKRTLFSAQQDGQNGFLDMEAVLSLVKDLIRMAFKNGRGDLLAAVGGQAVEHHVVGLGRC